MHTDQTTPATTISDSSYPSAAAVLLIDNDDTAIQPVASASTEYRQSEFASAHVVVGNGDDDSMASPSNGRFFADATETEATATALDPWSKEPTVATLNRFEDPESSDNLTPAGNHVRFRMPAALLEDPLHKKYRRRRRRRARMVLGGASGLLLGSFLLGPIGAVAIALGTASVVRASSKARERKKDERVRRQLEEQVQQHLPEAE
eukprot:scaffold23796_cov181-Cylindrotheca_fusiformis.AAC.1